MDVTHDSLAAIAKVCHEVNRGYCQAIGDNSQKTWAEAEAWQRESAIAGVLFAIKNPNAGPDHQHNAWLADKTRDGWIYGPVKNPERKTHPCCVPYEALPLEQKVKDYLFKAVVRGMT